MTILCVWVCIMTRETGSLTDRSCAKARGSLESGRDPVLGSCNLCLKEVKRGEEEAGEHVGRESESSMA